MAGLTGGRFLESGSQKTFLIPSNKAECLIQPVVDAAEGESLRSDLAVSPCSLGGGKAHEDLGAGRRVRMARQRRIILGH